MFFASSPTFASCFHSWERKERKRERGIETLISIHAIFSLDRFIGRSWEEKKGSPWLLWSHPDLGLLRHQGRCPWAPHSTPMVVLIMAPRSLTSSRSSRPRISTLMPMCSPSARLWMRRSVFFESMFFFYWCALSFILIWIVGIRFWVIVILGEFIWGW